MKALLKKDFYFLGEAKSQLMIILIAVIAAIVLAKINPNFAVSFVSSYILIVCAMRTSSTIAYDEENNGFSYMMTMAISRKTYVDSKYVLAVIISIATGIVIALLSGIVEIIAEQSVFATEDGVQLTLMELLKIMVLMQVIYTCMCLIFTSIYLPTYLKYGAKKGAFISSIGLLGMFLIIIVVISTMSKNHRLEQLIDGIAGGNILSVFAISLTVTAICTIISYSLSQKIMRAKEF